MQRISLIISYMIKETLVLYLRVAEKVLFLRLLKNAQMQVEHCEIPSAGAP